MNCSFYKRLFDAFLIVGSISLFACGNSGGGDEEDFEFSSSDLTNKYWYGDTYVDEKYSTDDAILVYYFNGNGELRRQEFSGRRDNSNAGNWSLQDNKLIINDESLDAIQEWTIDKSSSKEHLRLRSSKGNRDFYRNMAGLDELTADASVVNEVYLQNGSYINNYRYEFEVKGSRIIKAKALVSSQEIYDLIKGKNSNGENVWRLSEMDSKKYFTDFPGAKRIKFYVKMDSGEEFKLEEQIYDQEISPLQYQFVNSEHATGDGPLSVSVKWKALLGSNIYYYVQILNAQKDENNPLFTSNWQPASQDELQSLLLEEKTKGEFGLALGETFYVKVVGFIFEDGINPFQGEIQNYNIQVKSQFVKSGGEW